MDIINFVIWTGRENAEELKEYFHIGDVLEVTQPRIQQRDKNDTKYNPKVTSSLQLVFVDGKSMMTHHSEDSSSLLPLLTLHYMGGADSAPPSVFGL